MLLSFLGKNFRPPIRTSTVHPTNTVRKFLSYNSTMGRGERAYPRYSLFGTNCVLNLNVMPPTFSKSQSNVVYLDYGKRGRIIFEWVPRNAEGTFLPESSARFALSPEEIGLVIDRLPQEAVEFTRMARPGGGGHDDTMAMSQVSEDILPDKVFKMTPIDGGGVSFSLDFEIDGNGGQTWVKDDGVRVTGPLDVVGQRGEVVVLLELLRSALPALTGWNTMMDISMRNALNSSGDRGGGSGSSGRLPF